MILLLSNPLPNKERYLASSLFGGHKSRNKEHSKTNLCIWSTYVAESLI